MDHVMKKFKSLSTGICLTLIIVVVMAVLLTGCEAEVSFTTASLNEATMCTGIDDDLRPVGITDVFHVDTPEIFCTMKISSAPPDTEIKAEWIYVKGEVEDLTDYVIGEWSTEAGDSRYMYASLTCPDKGWPRGSYKVVMYVNDKEELSVPFTVE